MFTRIQWRIAANYVVLIVIALAPLALASYFASFFQAQPGALEMGHAHQARLVAARTQHRLTTDAAPNFERLAR